MMLNAKTRHALYTISDSLPPSFFFKRKRERDGQKYIDIYIYKCVVFRYLGSYIVGKCMEADSPNGSASSIGS